MRLLRQGLGGIVLAALVASACATQTRSGAARPASDFARSLSLSMAWGRALSAGDTSAKADFTLTNTGSAAFDGCFGPSWGVSVIVGDHDAGYSVRADHPRCDEKVALLPGQKIVWSKTVPLSGLHEGTAKVTGWVKVVDPMACQQPADCHETSVATSPMTVAVGVR
jgi:hypothetical protein